MADPYTISDPMREALQRSRAADSAAARAALAGPIPPPPIPPTATTPAATLAAPAAAQPVNKLAYGAGRAVGALGSFAGKAAVASPLAGFGDYQADTGGIDTSAGGTLGYLAKGELGNAGASLGGGAAEALADSGRGVAKTIDGIAGYIGAKPGLTQGYDSLVQKGLGGYLSLRPEAPPPAGPMTAASKVNQRVSDIAQSNPELFSKPAAPVGAPTANAAPLRDAAYDRQPSLVVPSTADADRNFLRAAFAEHINSGDLERAAATAVTPEERAALGIAYAQHRQAQAQAAQTEPIQRMLMEQLNKSPRERALDEDPRTRAFTGVSGRRGAQPAPANGNDAIQGLLQQVLASQKGGAPQQSPMAQALAQSQAQQASETNIEGQKIAQAGAKITQQGLAQTQALQKQLLTETDPAKREKIIENIQTLTGKYDKAAPAAKAVIEDYDTGQKDMMGQPIYKKRAINSETGEPVSKPPAAAKPTRAEERARADRAIAAGANKDAVNADFNAKMKALGL